MTDFHKMTSGQMRYKKQRCKHSISTVKHGGGSFMIWVCFTVTRFWYFLVRLVVVIILLHDLVLSKHSNTSTTGKLQFYGLLFWPRSLASDTRAKPWVKLVTVGFRNKTQTQGAGWCEDNFRIEQKIATKRDSRAEQPTGDWEKLRQSEKKER